jgi:hypothetical protein
MSNKAPKYVVYANNEKAIVVNTAKDNETVKTYTGETAWAQATLYANTFTFDEQALERGTRNAV